MKIRCYVDGLNFYYGIAKPLNFKWINLKLLLEKTLESVIEGKIEQVTLFTAKVLGEKDAIRQDIYLKALKHTGVVVKKTGGSKRM